MSYPVSSRVRSLAAYPFALLGEKKNALIAAGVTPIDFGVGDPTIPTPEVVRERLKIAVDLRARSGYPSYIGDVAFREAAAAWVQRRFSVDLDPATQVTATIGSKEGIFNFPLGFVDPGDIVLCPSPGYPPYPRGTSFAGAEPYFLPLTRENRYLPDLAAIPAEVVDRARILWLCYPNAPTGAVAPGEFLARAIEWGRKHKVIVVNDEAYSETYFTDEPPHSILEYGIEGVVAFHSLSKRSAMTGWRIGFTAGDAEILATFRKVKTNVDSGVPTFIQDAAIAALEDEAHVVEARNDYRTKRDLLAETFVALGLDDCRPDATIHFWQRLPKNMDAIEFATRLLDPNIGVVATPGPWVSDACPNGLNPGEGYVRFSLVPSIEETKLACEKIRANADVLLGS
ncbi:MAG: aminotransferase class I/II-fold pyridoxal phosphate-dependent enzyme [Planctomycetota bacterium]